jgi:hypothetical protein
MFLSRIEIVLTFIEKENQVQVSKAFSFQNSKRIYFGQK